LCSEGILCYTVFTKFYPGDQMKANEMGRACGMFGGEERYIEGFGGEK
jgi:hypothetical protein